MLDPGLVLGLVTEQGWPDHPDDHRQLGLPCVVAHGAMEIRPVPEYLDGTTGLVEVDPDETEAAARVARH